jgi:hypothetical protein
MLEPRRRYRRIIHPRKRSREQHQFPLQVSRRPFETTWRRRTPRRLHPPPIYRIANISPRRGVSSTHDFRHESRQRESIIITLRTGPMGFPLLLLFPHSERNSAGALPTPGRGPLSRFRYSSIHTNKFRLLIEGNAVPMKTREFKGTSGVRTLLLYKSTTLAQLRSGSHYYHPYSTPAPPVVLCYPPRHLCRPPPFNQFPANPSLIRYRALHL